MSELNPDTMDVAITNVNTEIQNGSKENYTELLLKELLKLNIDILENSEEDSDNLNKTEHSNSDSNSNSNSNSDSNSDSDDESDDDSDDESDDELLIENELIIK